MRINMVDHNGTISDDVRDFAERRLRFALSRFGGEIRQVLLVISDTNGPRGGVDQLCKVSVRFRRLPTLVASHQDAGLRPCLAKVAEKAGRAVSRKLSRDPKWHRTSRPIPSS